MTVQLIRGDCLEILPTLPDGSVHLVLTDPPYGHNNNNNGDLIHRREAALGHGEHGEARIITNDGAEANEVFRAVLPEFARLLKPGCCCCCCCGGGGGPDPQFARWSLWIDQTTGLEFKQMVVWDKGPMGMGWHYRRSYETVLVAQRAGAACAWYDETNRIENIIRPGYRGIRKIIPSAEQHPTEKPWQLAAFFIGLHTQPGDTVIDPFMGSGAFGEAAVRMGKAVYCEKPMATTLEDCEAMVATAKANKRFLMIGQNQRLAKAHVKAKQLLKEGLIGDLVTFRTTCGHAGPETWSIDPGKDTWFFDKNQAVMGAMADLGIHKTDLIHFLTDQTIIETTARLVTLDKRDATGSLIGVDDNAICIYRLSGGAIGTMSASWTHYGVEDNSTILYGTKGIMRIYDDPNFAIVVNLNSGERILFELDKIQTNEDQTKSGVIDLFVDGLLADTEPEISGAEVLKSMRVIFASIESSETGMPVAINHD